MAQLTIADIPEGILKELQDRADHCKQHVEDVARSVLVHAVTSVPWRQEMSEDELLEKAQKIRDRHPNAWVTEEFLQNAKSDGRA